MAGKGGELYPFYFTYGLLTVITTAYPTDSDFILRHSFVSYADDCMDEYRRLKLQPTAP
jgi:hypothetical protein